MPNFNFNKVILGGRLCADPELRQTASGVSVCNARLAVTRKTYGDNEPMTDFINVVAWRAGAEFLAKYFKKGSSICITGSIVTGSYEDNDGNVRYTVDVQADEIYFVDSKKESESAEGARGAKPVANNRNARRR